MKRLLALALVAQAAACSGASPLDAGVPLDAGTEASNDGPVAPSDAGSDIPLADTLEGSDAALDVAAPDAAADAGPPTGRDLARMYARETIEMALFTERAFTRAAAPMSCAITAAGALNFSARVCGAGSTCVTVSGDAPPASDGGGSTVFVMYATGQSNSTVDVHVARGARYSDATGTLQNFHLTFAAAAMGSVPAVTGIAGTTLSPDYADAWLLGCPQQ